MPETQELLKIGELARRAGVNRGTIHHYMREGLLPRPVKRHRNMAWYDAACVERIRLIKDLQKQRFLPLNVIRRIIASRGGSGAQLKAAVEQQQQAMAQVAPETQASSLTLDSAAKTFDMPRRLLQEMEKIGLVTSYEQDGERVFTGPDIEVLTAIAQLKELGFTEKLGFRSKDMLIYKTMLESLLDQEMQTFLRVVVGKRDPEEATRLAQAAVQGATGLLVALRKKLIVDTLAAAGPATVGQVLSGGKS